MERGFRSSEDRRGRQHTNALVLPNGRKRVRRDVGVCEVGWVDRDAPPRMFTFVAVVKACVAACGGEVAHEQQEKDGPKIVARARGNV